MGLPFAYTSGHEIVKYAPLTTVEGIEGASGVYAAKILTEADKVE